MSHVIANSCHDNFGMDKTLSEQLVLLSGQLVSLFWTGCVTGHMSFSGQAFHILGQPEHFPHIVKVAQLNLTPASDNRCFTPLGSLIKRFYINIVQNMQKVEGVVQKVTCPSQTK